MSGFRIFSIGNIPVSVSPWYLLLLVWWVKEDFAGGILWAVCVTVSILVHELGHALVARYYRLHPQILLHGLGGLCQHDRAERDLHDALIVAAGPGAGLLLGVLSLGAMLLSYVVPGLDGPIFQRVVWMMIWVNVIWSFVNLLPVWPLDGGQLFRLGLIQVLKPRTAEKITHWTAVVFLLGALGLALAGREIFLGVLAAFGLYQNYRALKGEIASGTYRPVNKRAKELLAAAQTAYAADDWAEAARLCHVLRTETTVDEKTLAAAWQILGPSTARLGRHEEALSFLRRASSTPEVIEATIECLHVLGEDDELRGLVASPAFQKISPARRQEILDVLEI